MTRWQKVKQKNKPLEVCVSEVPTTTTTTTYLPLCLRCATLRERGNYCPLCNGCYEDDDYEAKVRSGFVSPIQKQPWVFHYSFITALCNSFVFRISWDL